MVTAEPEIQGCWAVDPGKRWPGNSTSSLNKVGDADPRQAFACPEPAARMDAVPSGRPALLPRTEAR